jgi:hypothetical protein
VLGETKEWIDWQQMNRAEIVNNLKEIDRMEHFDNRELTSLLYIKEMEIKTGAPKNVSLTGCKRRYITQHRRVTISHSTLIDMARWGSKHLCTCLVCNKDSPSS